ncbi:Rab family GTPase [Legionella sp. WA2022007384]
MSTEKLVPRKHVKVGFFGGAGSGKSQLVNVLAGNAFSTYSPSNTTVRTNNVSLKEENILLGLSDFSTKLNHPDLIKSFSEISVICIDQSNPSSLKAAEKYVEEVQLKLGDNAPIIIAITKTDKESNISDEEISEFKDKYNITSETIKTSAKQENCKDLQKSIIALARAPKQNQLPSEKPTKIADKEVAEKITDEEVKEKISYLKPMITAALKKIEGDHFKKTGLLPLNEGPYLALTNFEKSLDTAKTHEEYQTAAKAFKKAVPEYVLNVQPPEVRSVLRLIWDFLSKGWSSLADTHQETTEKERFKQQTKLKGELSSIKHEEDEPKSEKGLSN